SFWSIEIETRRLNAERRVSTHPRSLTVVPRMTGNGASRPLRRIPSIVSFLNRQPALSLVGGNRSSCPFRLFFVPARDCRRRVESGDQWRPRNLPIACRKFAG